MNPTELYCPTETNGNTQSRVQFDITSYSQNANGGSPYSIINWRIRLRSTDKRSNFYACGLWIDGNQVFFNNTTLAWNAWTDGYVLGTGSTTVWHNSDGSKQFSVILKQLFYLAYNPTNWGGDQYYSGDTSKTEVASTTITATTIPMFPVLSLTSVYRELNLLWPTLSNTRTGTITSWEVRRVDNSALVTSGTSASVNFGLYGLSPNTNYDGVYKVRAYANGGWGEYLTINIGATTALPTVSAQNVSSESASVITFSNLNHIQSWSLEVRIDNDDSYIYGFSGATSNNYSMTLPAGAKTSLLAAYPSSIYPKVKLIITAYSNGYGYRIYQSGSTDATITYTIPDSLYKPTFNLAMIGYADQNSVSTNLTGSNQKIIKGISNVLFTLQPMTANGGATPVNYQVNSGSIFNTGNHTGSAITVLLNAVNAGSATVTAIDSRGKTTTISLNYAQYVDYAPPTISAMSILRNGGVTKNVIFNISGLFNNWTGLATTNNIQTIQYRYKVLGAPIEDFSSYATLTGTTYAGVTYTLANVLTTGDLFDISTKYDIEVKITDKITSYNQKTTLNSGEPLLWKDLENKLLGIGRKPDSTLPDWSLDVGGALQVNGTVYINSKSLLDMFYPIGTIYETTSGNLDTTTKMAAHFGGTWEAYGDGRVLVAKSTDTEFDTIGETGGAKTHTLTVAQMPFHKHFMYISPGGGTSFPAWAGIVSGSTGAEGSTAYAGNTSYEGGNQAHNNLQPYIVVYRYRRTA